MSQIVLKASARKGASIVRSVTADMETLKQTGFATDLCHNKSAAESRK
jgi:hypothetical protein